MSDDIIPADRLEQLERRREEEEAEIREMRFTSPRSFKRAQEKARKKSESQDRADELIAQLGMDGDNPMKPPAPPSEGEEGRRPHKAGKVFSQEQAEYYEKLAAAAQKEKAGGAGSKNFSVGNDYAAEATVSEAIQSDRSERFEIGHDYAREADLQAAIQSREGKKQMSRQPTIMAVAEKAPKKSQSAAAQSLISDLAGLDLGASNKAKPVRMDRQKSISVPVDGPRIGAAELAQLAQPLEQSAWFEDELGRSQFEARILGAMEGDFLVRKSGSSSGYVLCVNDFGQPINFSISVVDPGPNQSLEFIGLSFATLFDVVTHARKTPLKSRTQPGQRLMLGFPAIRERWYPLGKTRTEIERKVAGAPNGGFAVRLSSSKDKYVLVVNDQGDVCSYSITKVGKGRWGFGGSAHDRLEDVITHIYTHPFASKNTPLLTLTESAY